ncbi:LANO_0C04038g1_1 [Lachancea nothofagi CBS 11611]|uniref:LANO_0C04038g1_1 n=1 Tax=Lachancea nothofagi CBS 11611 TaxID=1266666 RepID=A0A1G4J6J8_9SACH|nr:LANO_0C04038g1_1 [Lachancea nothofagi CBS 11611]
MDNGRDEILQTLARGNGKLALQLSGKLCAQFPKASYPKLLEQYVRFRHNKSKYSAETMLEPLLDTPNPPSDLRSLELLHVFRQELEQFDCSLDGYKKAMRKYPSLEIGYNWFSKAIEDFNLQHMVQASFQLRRWSQEPRMMQFWNALSIVALVKLQNRAEDKINIQIAFKTVENLKPFQSDQETIIYCLVCEICGDKSQDIVELLLPAFKGANNAKFSVDLYLKNFMLKHLTILCDYSNLFIVCSFLLTLLDDFEIITKLIESAKALGKPREEVEMILSLRDSRNHRLANMQLDVVYCETIKSKSLKHYLERFHDKPCCVADLNHFQDYMSPETIKLGMNAFSGGLLHDCNYSKLTGDHKMEHFVDLFVKYKPTLSEKPKTDYSSCSYFILRIVENLVNDKHLTLENALTSVAILEQYQALDPYNFDTRVWLVVLYNYLGSPTMAYEHFAHLKVKNLQNESLNYLMASRYSSLFPVKDHPFVEHLETSDKLYDSTTSLPRFIQIAFERKSYSKILGMLELHDKMTLSLTRLSELTEQLQRARLFNDKRGELLKKLHESFRALCQSHVNRDSLLDRHRLHLKDNRDLSVLGPMDSCFEVTAYIDQSNDAVIVECIQEMLLELSVSGERSTLLEEMLMHHNQKELVKEMTPSEFWAFTTICLVYESQFDESKISELQTQLNKRPEIHRQTWRLAHDFHTQMATLKSLDQLKRIKNPGCKTSIKTQLRQLRDLGPDYFQDYIAAISSTKVDSQLLKRLGFASEEPCVAISIMATFKVARNL